MRENLRDVENTPNSALAGAIRGGREDLRRVMSGERPTLAPLPASLAPGTSIDPETGRVVQDAAQAPGNQWQNVPGMGNVQAGMMGIHPAWMMHPGFSMAPGWGGQGGNWQQGPAGAPGQSQGQQGAEGSSRGWTEEQIKELFNQMLAQSRENQAERAPAAAHLNAIGRRNATVDKIAAEEMKVHPNQLMGWWGRKAYVVMNAALGGLIGKFAGAPLATAALGYLGAAPTLGFAGTTTLATIGLAAAPYVIAAGFSIPLIIAARRLLGFHHRDKMARGGRIADKMQKNVRRAEKYARKVGGAVSLTDESIRKEVQRLSKRPAVGALMGSIATGALIGGATLELQHGGQNIQRLLNKLPEMPDNGVNDLIDKEWWKEHGRNLWQWWFGGGRASPEWLTAAPTPAPVDTRNVGVFRFGEWTHGMEAGPTSGRSTTLTNILYNYISQGTTGSESLRQRVAELLMGAFHPGNMSGFTVDHELQQRILGLMGAGQPFPNGWFSPDIWTEGQQIDLKRMVGRTDFMQKAVEWITNNPGRFGIESLTAQNILVEMFARANGLSVDVARARLGL